MTILLGWTLYVISLSQAGKHSALVAITDALKAVGKGDASIITGTRGMGTFKSIAGGKCLFLFPFRSDLLQWGFPPGIQELGTRGRYWTDMTATSAYILTFGILGFIPAPSVGRKD
jgi:hypothetical protein